MLLGANGGGIGIIVIFCDPFGVRGIDNISHATLGRVGERVVNILGHSNVRYRTLPPPPPPTHTPDNKSNDSSLILEQYISKYIFKNAFMCVLFWITTFG